MPVLDLQRFDVDIPLARLLPEIQARRYLALLLRDQGDSCLLGLVDPNNLRAQDAISQLLKRPVDVVQVDKEALLATLDRVYGKTDQIGEFAREVERNIERDANIVDLDKMGTVLDDVDAPVVKLLQTIFDHAAQVRASDVHIEPQEKRLVVRYRIDGALHVQAEADLKIASPLVVRMKLMAGLDIAEKRLPQDGRIAVRSGLHKLDVRMSTLPTLYGESVVLRILMQQQGLVALTDTGMDQQVFRRFEAAIRAPHGIVLVTGPTGSGKTTTLYGALQMLNQPDVKILTCEDPVEYRMAGIVQVQTNDKIGLDFARVLRSFLRQDPDVIFIGEIRDQETAQIASRAAMTGHLVLSTLHTNDALSTPGRLADMGIPPYLIASTLLAVVSQRLVRLCCPHCVAPHEPDADEMQWLLHSLGRDQLPQGAKLMRGCGCPRCNGIGYRGRTGVHEILTMTPALARTLRSGTLHDFEAAAQQELAGATIAQHVLQLVLDGKTTVAEAMKIASWDEG
ncbi:MAG: GspE/PulE family protein [Burkholderiaceae bacterium]|nr:GspE/PulE family protein [Burkholderiaceae bacterium]